MCLGLGLGLYKLGFELDHLSAYSTSHRIQTNYKLTHYVLLIEYQNTPYYIYIYIYIHITVCWRYFNPMIIFKGTFQCLRQF
jgi:hypothetical protein